MNRSQPAHKCCRQRVQTRKSLKLQFLRGQGEGLECAWAGPLAVLEAGHGGLGRAQCHSDMEGGRSPVSVSWGIHCTWGWVWGFSLETQKWARPVCLNQPRMERTGGDKLPRQQKIYHTVPLVSGICQELGFLHLPLTEINQLMCPKKFPVLPPGFKCWLCHSLTV